MRGPSSDLDIVKTGVSSHEVPTGGTPVVGGALSQVLPSQTTCWLAVESKATLSMAGHGPPSTAGGAVPIGVAGGFAGFAGPATVTPGGTWPVREATTGIRGVALSEPHSLLCTVWVCTPRKVPSGSGVNVHTTVSDWVDIGPPRAVRHCTCTWRGSACQWPSTKCRTPALPVPPVLAT